MLYLQSLTVWSRTSWDRSYSASPAHLRPMAIVKVGRVSRLCFKGQFRVTVLLHYNHDAIVVDVMGMNKSRY